MVNCCTLLAIRSLVLEVRSRRSWKPPPKQMLFSVLTRKGKVPRLSFQRSRPGLRGGGPCAGRLPCPGALVQHPDQMLPQCPGLAEEVDLSCRRPQGQASRPCPAVITEGTGCPGPSQTSGSSGSANRGRVLWASTHGDHSRHQVPEAGMGERFPSASRPGPGQQAAVARALELCRTQPSDCPQAPHLTRQAQGQGSSRAPRRRFPSASHRTLSAARAVGWARPLTPGAKRSAPAPPLLELPCTVRQK